MPSFIASGYKTRATGGKWSQPVVTLGRPVKAFRSATYLGSTRGAGRYIGRNKKKPDTRLTIVKGPWAFTDAYMCKLHYCDHVTLSPTTSLAYIQYKQNGIYDPQVAVGGHQPKFYDQLTAVYDSWVVYKMKWSVKAFNQGTSMAAMIGTRTHNTNTVYTTIDDLRESPLAQFKLISARDGGPSVKTLTGSVKTGKVFGIPSTAVTAEASYHGQASADPSNTSYWTLYTQAVDESTSINVTFSIALTYYVKFFDRKIVGGS